MTTPNTTRSEPGAAARRCPSCGERLAQEPTDGHCPLCGCQVGPPPLTAEDTTPYAQAQPPGWRAWASMCLWVLGAGSQRLAYLALTRRSRPCTRFFRYSLLVWAVATAMFAATQFGWRRVPAAFVRAPAAAEPQGKGWIRIAGPALHATASSSRKGNELWWNLPLMALGASLAFVAALLAGWLLLILMAAGCEKALRPQFRGQERFAATLRYGSAWVVWLLPASLVSLLLPLGSLREVTGWWLLPSRLTVYLVVAMAACLGWLGGWFWLIRAAATAPLPTRSRVVVFHAVGTPLVAAAIAAVGWVGLVYGLGGLGPLLRLQW